MEAEGAPRSIDVILLADNQLHHLYGDPVWLRSGFTDKFVPVAIRPVQLDVYAPDVLRWIIEQYGDKRPVIHLGDALNIACTVEFEEFVAIMDTSERGWVLAPGNHDGYYFGNGHFAWSEWERACQTADAKGRPMTKDLFVEAYLQTLAKQSDAPSAERNGFGFPGPETSDTVRWEIAEGHPAFLSAVAWEIDRERPWRSYVVQRLDLTLPTPPEGSQQNGTSIIAILLDTNQYHSAPKLVPLFGVRNAGGKGEFLADQIQVVDEWLAEREPDQITIVMGHHPYHLLTGDARKAIDRWRRQGRVRLYVSAHTHRAQYFVHQSGESNWLELNLGSTTDWPPEFRSLSVSSARGYDHQVAFRMVRRQVHRLWEDGESPCDERWEVGTDRKDFYISYTDLETPDPHQTQVALMNTLLHSYEWMLRFVKSSPDNRAWPGSTGSDAAVVASILTALDDSVHLEGKLSMLRQLRAFEAGRTVVDAELRRRFRRCQAMWASKNDLHGARAPNVDDAYVLIPEE